MLAVGYNGSSTKAMLVSSSTNDFTNVLNGATLTIQNVSDTPVTVSVSSDTTNLASQIQSFVNSYNTFRQTLTTDTAYDTTTNTAAVLTGDYQTMRADTELSQLVSELLSEREYHRFDGPTRHHRQQRRHPFAESVHA